MVFKHLQDLFDPKDLANGFPQLFQASSHVTMGYILRSTTQVFGVVRLLTLAKPSKSI
jgi:hypothetical protein